MDMPVFYSRPAEVTQKIQRLQGFGLSNLHIVADFDGTLTCSRVLGEEAQSTYELIRAGGYLSPQYVERSYQLKHFYRPLEDDPAFPLEERCAHMQSWWREHWELLMECGVNRDVFDDIVAKKMICVRQGVEELLDFCHENKVPFLILSAGIGNLIELYLRSVGKNHSNVHIISNFFNFDDNGKAVSYDEKFIHSLNKSEVHVKEHPYHREVKERKNVILLGNTIGDADMVNGLDHNDVLKVGFLDADVDRKLPQFISVYDAVITENQSVDYVQRILREIK